jgi:hypothetical protein
MASFLQLWYAGAMADTLHQLFPLLVILPFLVTLLALFAKQMGIERDLKRGRRTIRTTLFWLTFAATVFAIGFCLEIVK